MKRTLFLCAGLFLCVYLAALGWTGVNFASYAIDSEELTLDAMEPRQIAMNEPLNLELRGTGFTADSRVFMHMDVNNQSAELGSLPIDGGLYDMAIDNNILYLAGNDAGVRRIDISNPRYPKIIGKPYHANSPVLDIEMNGQFLYLSCGSQGVKIDRIGADGRLLNWKNLPSWKVAIASKVVGKYLYVAAGNSGLLIYDLEQLDDFKPVAHVAADRPFRGIEAFGRYLYVVAGSDGVLIYKVGDSAVPALVGQVKPEETVKSVTVADGNLYVLENGLISQYLLTDPQKPQLISTQRHFSSPQRLYHVGEKLYVSDNHNGLGIIDNSHNRLPETADFLSVGGNAGAVVPVGDYLYVAVSRIGLKVLDPEAILARNIVSSVNTFGAVTDFLVIDDQMYTFDSADGLLLHDLTNLKAKPRKVDASPRLKLTHKGSFLYAASPISGVVVIDVSRPSEPVIVTKWPKLKANHVAVAGNYLVAANALTGLALFKIFDENQTKIVDQLIDVSATKVFAENGLVIAAGEVEGVRLYRIENDKLKLLSRVNLPFPLDQFSGALSLAVAEDTLFVANGKGGLMIVNIEDPERPVLLSSISLPGYANDMLIEGGRAFVTSRYSGLHTIDISELRSPHLLDTINISDLEGGLQRYKDLIYLGNRFMGVTAIPVPREITTIIQRSEDRLEITVPPPVFPGRYSLEVSSEESSVALNGVLQYQ